MNIAVSDHQYYGDLRRVSARTSVGPEIVEFLSESEVRDKVYWDVNSRLKEELAKFPKASVFTPLRSQWFKTDLGAFVYEAYAFVVVIDGDEA